MRWLTFNRGLIYCIVFPALAFRLLYSADAGSSRGAGRGHMSDQANEIREVIFSTLRASLPQALPLSDSTLIIEDLGLDSVAVMDFVMEIEDKLDISVPLDKIAEVKSLGDLITTVQLLKQIA